MNIYLTYEQVLKLLPNGVHGIALFDENGVLFIETKKDIDFKINNLDIIEVQK